MASRAALTPDNAPRSLQALAEAGAYRLQFLAEELGILRNPAQVNDWQRKTPDVQAGEVLSALQNRDRGQAPYVDAVSSSPEPSMAPLSEAPETRASPSVYGGPARLDAHPPSMYAVPTRHDVHPMRAWKQAAVQGNERDPGVAEIAERSLSIDEQSKLARTMKDQARSIYNGLSQLHSLVDAVNARTRVTEVDVHEVRRLTEELTEGLNETRNVQELLLVLVLGLCEERSGGDRAQRLATALSETSQLPALFNQVLTSGRSASNGTAHR